MIPNPLLSITIPTYNRADFLDFCLEVHIPLARIHNIQIFISDNASTDSTKQVVEKRQQEYPLIQYKRNETNVGPDKNFELALTYPSTNYVWLLGDTYQIPPEGINQLLHFITKKNKIYAAIIIDVMKRASEIPQQEYSDSNKLLSDLGWHMTCLATLVYSSDLISHANFERYQNSYFLQTGIILEYIANEDFLILWNQNISLKMLEHPQFLSKKGWYQQPIVFEIACTRWANFIFSLPASYDLEVKSKCILDHGYKSGVFSFKNLLLLRHSNILNYDIYKKYFHLLPLTMQYSRFTIFLISVFPRTAYKPLLFLWRLAKGKH